MSLAGINEKTRANARKNNVIVIYEKPTFLQNFPHLKELRWKVLRRYDFF